MADDHTQRPYRSNELPGRTAPVTAARSNSGSDPLAELARLIGQNDPFAEFGRDGARHDAPQRPAEHATDWSTQPAGAGYSPQTVPPTAPPNFGANDYYGATVAPAAHRPDMPFRDAPNAARQTYDSPPFVTDDDHYHPEHEAPGYAGAPASGYEGGPYYPNQAHQADAEEDMYDDIPPPRRRMGVMAIAAVFALAVIGTAGAFSYRALFGASGSSGPPPVIKADATPSKIVPAIKSKDPQSNKLIYDRVNERGQGEKLVSREEQPVEMRDKQTAALSNPVQPPALGSGVVGTEPKKIHTIAIHPDQSAAVGNAPTTIAPAPRPAPRPAPKQEANIVPAEQPAADQTTKSVSSAPSAPAQADLPSRQSKVAQPVRHAAAPASSNAPLSLNPNAPATPAPARSVAQVTHTASVPPPTQIAPADTRTRNVAVGGTGAYAVQVSSQRSEAEAQASFHRLQAKYPSQLGSRTPLIHRVDLGAKGIYFRAMVGPFASSNEAKELCLSLKAAGGNCIVQRN